VTTTQRAHVTDGTRFENTVNGRVKKNQIDAQFILTIFIYCTHTFVPPDDGPRYGRNM